MASATCLFIAELSICKGSTCPLHSHACAEIVFYRNCSGWLAQGGERLRYRDGDAAVYQPRLKHSDECEQSGTHLCVGVAGCGAETLPPGMWRATPAVKAVFAHLRTETQRQDAVHQATLDMLSGWLVTELRRMLEQTGAVDPGPRPPRPVRLVREILDTRFTETLSIQGLAESLSLHPDYLRQLFRKHVGVSPIHYLIGKRMDMARELLQQSDLPIKTIADRVGVENPYYFSRLFHTWVGRTPSQYRSNPDNRQTPRKSASR